MEKISSKKNTTAWIIRIVIFILFVVSAWTKIHDPIWMFEKQLVDLGICDWCLSHYLARLLIAFEFALGIAILFPHLLKKLVIPVTIGLLAAFCIHLTIQMVEFGPMNGNCGCFGTTIPMTPLEAFIKNVLTIGLLVWLYKLLPSKKESWKNIIYPILIFLACALFLFMAYPFCPCDKKKPIPQGPVEIEKTVPVEEINKLDDFSDSVSANTELSVQEKQRIQDSLAEAKKKIAAEEAEKLKQEKEQKEKEEAEAEAKASEKTAPVGPKAVQSKFSAYPTFNGKTVKIDEGKKTICMFAPGCEHCQETAKKLYELSKEGNTPPVFIYFLDEQPEIIPEFFKIAGSEFPYQVLSPGDFWTLLDVGSTPGVFGLWNGNVQQSYEGIKENEFDVEKFKSFALPK